MLFCLALVALIWIVSRATTLSWGPGIHVKLAQQLLDTMPDRLAPDQIELLERHADCFQYGCIAADIINLKQYGGLANHCHNWSIKERFEELVTTETEQVFVWGYLCHLAADVIAHNHFVPYQILYDLPPQVCGHTYWEARADSWVDEPTWLAVDALRLDTDLDSNDALIQKAVPKRALSMRSNKFIFNHVLLARAKRNWRGVMDKMRRRNPVGKVQEPYLEECLERCLENMFRTFDPRGLLDLRQYDPRGHDALRETRQLRRKLIEAHGNRIRGAEASRDEAEKAFGL